MELKRICDDVCIASYEQVFSHNLSNADTFSTMMNVASTIVAAYIGAAVEISEEDIESFLHDFLESIRTKIKRNRSEIKFN